MLAWSGFLILTGAGWDIYHLPRNRVLRQAGAQELSALGVFFTLPPPTPPTPLTGGLVQYDNNYNTYHTKRNEPSMKFQIEVYYIPTLINNDN